MCFAIRSERQICREVQVNLAYRWFCDLGLEDAIPDHSAFSRARNERFRQSDIFRRVFERVVGSCIEVGLVGGEGFAVDASLIEADANRQRSIPGTVWKKQLDPEEANRAVKEYLATLNDAAFGAATEVQPKFVSPSDPAAQWTGALRGPAFFAYADNYLIDVRHGVIVDVEASRAVRQAEVGAARTMLDRTEERFGLKPQRLVSRHGDNLGVRMRAPDLLNCLDALFLRHDQIRNDESRVLHRDHGYSDFAILGFDHAVLGALQHAAHELSHGRSIVDD
jgi:hypothetical protein